MRTLYLRNIPAGVIVVDASAAIAGLLCDGAARRAMSAEQVQVPHLVDAEVAGGLRRLVSTEKPSAPDGRAARDVWRRLAMTRYAVHSLLVRVWELRDSLSAYDACYAVLAEELDCPHLNGRHTDQSRQRVALLGDDRPKLTHGPAVGGECRSPLAR